MIETRLQVVHGGTRSALARHLTNVTAMRVIASGLPRAIVVANMSGGVFPGVLVAMRAHEDATRRAPFLMTGILAGFTMLFAVSLDAVAIGGRELPGLAVISVAGSVILAIGGIVAGMSAARWTVA